MEARRRLEGFLDKGGERLILLALLALSAEGENLLDQVPATFGGFEYGIQVVPYTVCFLGGVIKRQFRISKDDSEYVVEVVGDAARQGANSLHLVGLAELLLGS